jgi:hypothetical protein
MSVKRENQKHQRDETGCMYWTMQRQPNSDGVSTIPSAMVSAPFLLAMMSAPFHWRWYQHHFFAGQQQHCVMISGPRSFVIC